MYQDLNNSIFTFISPKDQYSKDRNTRSASGSQNASNNNAEIILRALEAAYGIRAEASGRNDITVNGQKISGKCLVFQLLF